MKKKSFRLAAVTLLVTMMGAAIAGCGSQNGNNDKSELSGSITVSGSSAMLPLMEQSI